MEELNAHLGEQYIDPTDTFVSIHVGIQMAMMTSKISQIGRLQT